MKTKLSNLRAGIGFAIAAALFAILLPDCFPQEIPYERCDQLPLIRVEGERPLVFLVDTGATSILNLKSFVLGESKKIQVTSWSGTTAATPARQVRLPDMTIGSYQLGGLSLPAIDLSEMGKACGKRIDGILGADLLDKMGAAIDFKRKVIYFTTVSDRLHDKLIVEINTDIQSCILAFNRSDQAAFAACLDDKITFYPSPFVVYLREGVLAYFQAYYFHLASPSHIELHSSHLQVLGDTAWLESDFDLDGPHGSSHAHGMAMLQKAAGHWRIQHIALRPDVGADKQK